MRASASHLSAAAPNYPGVYRVLHWTYAALISAQLVLMFTFQQMQTLEFGRLLLDLHISCGLLALAVAAIRVAWTPFRRVPSLPSNTSSWQVWSARLVHAALLGLLIAMPLLGWAIVSARGYDARFLGIVALPPLWSTNPAWADQLLTWHSAAACSLLALLAIHLGAVVFNAVIKKRDVMARMLPAPSRKPFRNRVPLWQQVILAAGVLPVMGASIGLSGLADNAAAVAAAEATYDHSVEALGHGYSARVDVTALRRLVVVGGVSPRVAPQAAGQHLQEAAEELDGLAQSAVTAAQRSAARRLALAAAQWPHAPPSEAQLKQTDAALDDILSALNSQAFAAKSDILHKSQRSHDLLVLTLGPALLVALVAALFVALNVRGLLRRVGALAAAIARRDGSDDQTVVGNGEIARLMRELLTTHDLLIEHEKALGASMSALTVARDTADAANEAKSQFLANVSHEIRTPLNGMLGMVQVMEVGDVPDDQRARLRVIRESGQTLLQVLNDVLDFSKIEARKLDLSPANFDVADLVRGAVSTFAASAEEKGLKLDWRLDESTLGIWLGDAVRIRQILLNLLANAIKFTDAGFVSLEVTNAGSELRFVIADSGIGIAANDVGRLFNKFSQVDGSATRRFTGTGLGLAICRELALLMGGEIHVESVLGTGSSFHLTLPMLRIGGEAQAEATEPLPPDLGLRRRNERPVRILAAEDNPTNQLVLSALLATLEVDLTLVGNGQDAVAAWRSGGFDLILMDIQMPEMGGVEATRIIRADERGRGAVPTPIIALSANALSHQVTQYIGVGMTSHVSKPIDFADLCAAIEKALTGSPEQHRSAAGVAY
jgi:two-component system, sensor histidine kinase